MEGVAVHQIRLIGLIRGLWGRNIVICTRKEWWVMFLGGLMSWTMNKE